MLVTGAEKDCWGMIFEFCAGCARVKKSPRVSGGEGVTDKVFLGYVCGSMEQVIDALADEIAKEVGDFFRC